MDSSLEEQNFKIINIQKRYLVTNICIFIRHVITVKCHFYVWDETDSNKCFIYFFLLS